MTPAEVEELDEDTYHAFITYMTEDAKAQRRRR